jgi:uncharacterized protein YdhG (YjbR/CyaY superfamily)
MKAKTVDEYIKAGAAAPSPRPQLRKLRRLIKKAAPKAEEKISYGIPLYKHHGMLVAFGAFKDHVSLFALTHSLLPKYKKEIKKYKTSAGTIQFPLSSKLPERLIKKLIKEKVKMKERKAKK